MDNRYENLIVIKAAAVPDREFGFVTPIGRLMEDGDVKEIDLNDFPPRGTVFISKGYPNQIDAVFDENQIFLISEAHEANDYEEEGGAKTKVWSIGDWAKHLPSNVLLPIVQGHVPPADNPVIEELADSQLVNQQFFLDDETSLKGPFEGRIQNGEFTIRPPSSTLQLGIPSHHVLEVDKSSVEDLIFSIGVSDGKREYLTRIDAMRERGSTPFDYISNDALIRYASKNLLKKDSRRKLSKAQANDFVDALNDLKSLDEINDSRRERLVSMVSQLEKWEENRASIIAGYLKGDGKSVVEDYIVKNEKSILGRRLDEINEKVEEHRQQLNAEIEQLQQTRVEIEASIEEEKKRAETEKAQILREKQEELSSEVNSLEARKGELEGEIGAIKKEHERLKDFESLDAAVRYLEQHQKILDRAVEERKAALSQPIGSLQSGLTELKEYIDLLNGRDPIFEVSDEESRALLSMEDTDWSTQDFVEHVLNLLTDELGRDYTYYQIANILICLQQSFLTILSGPPGVGKTSLVHLLAEVLGLKSRLHHVPVSRGWTSQKDILGYYNPLRGNYQQARTGLYGFLKHIPNDEVALGTHNWILLDEANLSPIEHYWADFLGMCDAEGERVIETGQPGENGPLEVSQTLRFIGTINHDSTTERLSPRLLDRVPVLQLEPSARFFGGGGEKLPDQLAVSYQKMQEMFGAREGDFEAGERELLQQIVEVLQSDQAALGSPIIISSRKRKNILNYITVARELSDGVEYMDYAIAQFVLPLIEGYGESYGKRLNALLEVVSANYLESSTRLLRRIIESGKDVHHSYSFFVQ